MKKILALVLTLCLLMTAVCFAESVETVEEKVNLIPLWDFEQGDVTMDGYYEYGCKIVEGGANDTAHCMRIRGANSGNGQWLNGLKEDTTYEVTVFLKVADREPTTHPTFGVNGYDGEGSYVALDNSDIFTEDWVQYTLQFHTAVGYTSALVYTWTFGEGDVDFFMDEIWVYELTAEEAAAATAE